MIFDNEPTMHQIDDFNGNESPQKRKTVNIIIASLLAIGVVYAIIKYQFSIPSDYIGTPQAPGINTCKV